MLKQICFIGEEYYFNFDISTHDKMVCSELIYIGFGKPTITPDHLTEILLQKTPNLKSKLFWSQKIKVLVKTLKIKAIVTGKKR